MPQHVLTGSEGYQSFLEELKAKGIKSLFLVCDRAVRLLPLDPLFDELKELNITVTSFDDFEPNPRYESVEKGIEEFHRFGSKMILAIGGGSAIDVAKCIKLYSNMKPNICYLEQQIVSNDIELFAIPTTAGTGSEATQYAVIYYQGEKQSIAHPNCIPSVVIFDAKLLKTLPDYQKKSAMMDALCHSIESAWSVHSNEESKSYSLKALRRIMNWMGPYLQGDNQAAGEMLIAANLAGKAINITQTTAAHAMSYKLTSFYKLAHGHSVVLCLPYLWRYMRKHLDRCIDPRGPQYLLQVFGDLAKALGCPNEKLPETYLAEIIQKLELKTPENWKEEDIQNLAASVNPVRLKNNPIALDNDALEQLYRNILSGRWPTDK